MKLCLSDKVPIGSAAVAGEQAFTVSKLIDGQQLLPAVNLSCVNAKGVVLDEVTVCLNERSGKITLTRLNDTSKSCHADTLTSIPVPKGRKKKS